MKEIIDSEFPKVARLAQKGATEFYLLTNVRGTAHLDVGTIDQLLAAMREKLQMPCHCWWRDDLNRRLDDAWSIKWSYPDLFTGPDILRLIIENGLSEFRERRSAAMRSFLRNQYVIDSKVRFRQIDLPKNLLDLFTDVRTAVRDEGPDRKTFTSFRRVARHLERQVLEEAIPSPEDAQDRLYTAERAPVGTADLLLGLPGQRAFPVVVLEGAPGQGKSTITQYICQVHRIRLLNEARDLSLIPDHLKVAPIRLPFRIDLRDFATWIERTDPFEVGPKGSTPAKWHRSLESFLAALVRHHSGGTEFSADDFLAVARVSALLLVFDGLDEVADVRTRQDVVEEIEHGLQRIEVNSASLQVIVTSRPPAFANSPGMPPSRYTYLTLLPLTVTDIEVYASRWLKARNIEDREASEVRRTLMERIRQPHLRELARNPMQLSILLSLIHTRESSLPDKRTALYDIYIDLFLTRESQKSAVVRENRQLLIDIHQYVAWVLHSESETGNSQGCISEVRLLDLVSRYLRDQGCDVHIARVLFGGMVERVVALVSRVEGTFEFEVQPLREYFAARFLSDTAPYSPPGGERRGTKPDRFDAIVRNLFWLNVTRFFAGCFSKGELAGLAERLEELIQDEHYRLTSHPATLTVTLLQDWVFAQNPKSVIKLVNLLLTGPTLRILLATRSRSRAQVESQSLTFPAGSGREQILEYAYSQLEKDLPSDVRTSLIALIRANSVPSELVL